MTSTAATQGARLLEQGLLPDAVRAFSEGLEANPEDADCLLGLGRARLEQGERAEAEATLRRLLALHPGHLGAESHLAALAASLGDEAAVDRLRELAARPGAGCAEHLNLGNALFDRDDRAGAEAAFAWALASNPESLPALVELGRLRLYRGDADGAVALLSKAALAPGSDPLALVLLYRAHRERGEWRKAAELASLAARAVPRLGVIREDLHGLALLAGDVAEAAKQAGELRALDADSPRYALLHAAALAAAGQPDKAG